MKPKDFPIIALVTGICSWLFCPLILAIVAWIVGNQALSQPPGTYTDGDMVMIKVGRFLGIAQVVLIVFGMCSAVASIVLLGGQAFYWISEGAKNLEMILPLR